MTVVYDEQTGNLFNAELMIKVETDIDELKLLSETLLKQRNELYNMLESAGEELFSVIGKLNKYEEKDFVYGQLTPPDKTDMETCHIIKCHLALISGLTI